MSIQSRLAQAYLEKLYQQGLITLNDKQELGEEARRRWPDSAATNKPA